MIKNANNSVLNKKELSERDICTKFILPTLVKAGWDEVLQLRAEFEIGRLPAPGVAAWQAENDG